MPNIKKPWVKKIFVKAKKLYLAGLSVKEIAKRTKTSMFYFYNRNKNGDTRFKKMVKNIGADDYKIMLRHKHANSKAYDRLQDFSSPKERWLEQKSQYLCHRIRKYERGLL